MILDHAALSLREAFCADLARSAAALALEGFASQAGQSFDLKGPQDYLTETDGAVERHIKARLAEAFPDDGFLGEETGGVPGETAWVVDPIDGTANFARAIPHFCISISFVAGGQTQLGAIINPVLGDLHLARLGRGATRNGNPMAVSRTTDMDAATVELGWSRRVASSEYLAVLTRLLAAGSNVRRGASGALALAYVADGRSDGYVELHMSPWDCLAGLLMVSEAGGQVGPFLALGGLRDGAPVLAASPGVAGVLSAASGIALLTGADRIAKGQAE